MKNFNVGISNLILSDIIINSYINNNNLNESKLLTNNYVNTIKKSDLLSTEHKIINNIENKYIKDENLAIKYIENNIKLFEIFTIDEYKIEHNKLYEFINPNYKFNESSLNDKITLYNSISDLLLESISNYKNVNVDNIHESFTYILNYIKTPKISKLIENTNNFNTEIEDNHISLAIKIFNENYSSLNEDEVKFIKILIDNDDINKSLFFENLKTDILNKFENYDNINNDLITKGKEKINEMKCDENNIIKLIEFKKNTI